MSPRDFKIGTCSWKYDSWAGILYQPEDKSNYLKKYATRFNTVEIDQWFWSLYGPDQVTLPGLKDVEAYVSSVPDDFRFTVKVPNSITLTHFYKKKPDDPLVQNPYFLSPQLFEQFLQSIRPMKSKLGPLLFQFEYLNKQKMANQTDFLNRLDQFIQQCPGDYSYAIELRNPNYINGNYFDLLDTYSLSPVFLQGYFMPSIFELYAKYHSRIQDQAVIRLHGPNRQEIEAQTQKKWNQIVSPKDDDLDQLSNMLADLMNKNVTIFLNVNNHFEGCAPITIQRIWVRINRSGQ